MLEVVPSKAAWGAAIDMMEPRREADPAAVVAAPTGGSEVTLGTDCRRAVTSVPCTSPVAPGAVPPGTGSPAVEACLLLRLNELLGLLEPL